MGVREGGSYVVESSGAERLVERTRQDDAPQAVEAPAAPDVMSAPAAPLPETEADAASDPSASRVGGSDTKSQE